MESWYYAKSNHKHGPVTLDALKVLVSSGFLGRGDMLLKEGESKWVPVSSVIELAEAIALAPPVEATANSNTMQAVGNMKQQDNGTTSFWRKQLRVRPGGTIGAGIAGAAIVFLCGLCCLGVPDSVRNSFKKTRIFSEQRWEYKIKEVDDREFEKEMNALGDQGWELVSSRRVVDSVTNRPSYEMIFKRRP